MAARSNRKKNAERAAKAARGGAAVFAVGLFLAGPQAIAAADISDTPSGSEGPEAASSAEASRASRVHTGPRATRTRPGSRDGGSIGLGAAQDSAQALTPLRALTVAARVGAPERRHLVVDTAGAPTSAAPAASISLVDRQAAASAGPTAPQAYLTAAANTSGAAVVTRAGSTTVMTPMAALAHPMTASAVIDRIVSAETTVLNSIENWLADLPTGGFTTYLQGALLMMRKSLFNVAPRVTPSRQTTSQLDGTIRGNIGAIDLEGDELTYSVVAGPHLGTVEVAANGGYVYTPGADYAGSDSFIVTIAPEKRTLNLLNLGSDGSREVTIQVGAATGVGAPGQSSVDHADVAVYLPSGAGHITVKKGLFNQFTGTVTLNSVAPDTQLTWMDSAGNFGAVSVEDLVAVKWPEFEAKATENGATVNLTIAYSADDGSQYALLLRDVAVDKDAVGQFVFTGQLRADSEIDTSSADLWDVVGAEFKPLYENFLKTYNIGKPQTRFTAVEVDFSHAAVFADTYTPLSYQRDGLYALDSEVVGQQPANASNAAALTTSASALGAISGFQSDSSVSASAALGRSFVVGRADGSVELWTDGQMQLLRNPSHTPVQSILEYNRPLQDDQGATIDSSFMGTITGTTLTVTVLGAGSSVVVGQEITGDGIVAGTTITRFIQTSAQCTTGDCSQIIAGAGGTNGFPGTYEVSIAQDVASTKITQQSIPATAPGFIAALGDGSVELWSATSGWTVLQQGRTWGAVTALATYGEGIAVGNNGGSVRIWTGPGGSLDSDTWKNNWIELTDGADWRQPVTAILAQPQDNGIVISYGRSTPSIPNYSDQNFDGRVMFWDPTNGFTELQDEGWRSGVSAMIAYGSGVAFGLENGTVQYWDGTVSPHSGWTQLKGGGWGQRVNTMATYGDDGLIVGLGDPNSSNPGAVEYHAGYGSNTDWHELHDNGWGSAVATMTTFSSSAIGSGVVVGLKNGSVQLWNGDLSKEQSGWTELHDRFWGAGGGVATLIPYEQNVIDAMGNVVAQDGVVAGMTSGAIERWSGLISGDSGQNDWTEIFGSDINRAAQILDEDGLLQEAIEFGTAVAQSGSCTKDGVCGASPTWGAAGSVGGADDPLFSLPYFQAAATHGTYVPIASYIPRSVTTTLADGVSDVSVDLSYDVNVIAYGYAYVPDGALAKLVPGDWSLAMLAGLETGPSVTVNLGEGGTINIPEKDLFNYQFFTPGPLGIDTFAIDVGANGELSATLIGASDQLTAHAYMVPGMLFTYNTQADPNGVELGFNAYADIDYSDFTKITGVSITPTLTPYVTASYGVFAPDAYWLIGGLSLFKLSLGYENPVSLTICADTTGACANNSNSSLTLDTEGYVTAHAGILESLTSAMTWDGRYQVYDVSETF